MKHFFTTIGTILLLIVLCGCSVEEEAISTQSGYNFNGVWYDRYANLYQFSEGEIYCKEHTFTLEGGREITGAYTAYDDYIDIFVITYGLYNSEVKPMYLILIDDSEVLSDAADGTGKNYFYRDQAMAEEVAEKENAELQAWIEKNNARDEERKNKINESKTNPIAISYDEVKSEKWNEYTVVIEGIVSSYEHTEYNLSGDTYSFDVWFWSEDEGMFIQDEYWRFDEDIHVPEIIDVVKCLTNGDKVRITVEIYEDGSFGASCIKKLEIIEHGTLNDRGIVVPVETAPSEDSITVSDERHVYVANSGSRFHTATCRTLKDSCKEISYTDAIARGYTPCGICNPVP